MKIRATCLFATLSSDAEILNTNVCTMKWNLSFFQIKKCQIMNTRKGIYYCIITRSTNTMVEMSAMFKWQTTDGVTLKAM